MKIYSSYYPSESEVQNLGSRQGCLRIIQPHVL
jgi:hypothetical protein